MSCYLRHLDDILDQAGIAITSTNRNQIDRAIHQIAGIAYKNCPATWKKIKEDIKGDDDKRQIFIEQLQKTLH
ncbi:MAG: hypothetical protein Q8O55_06215 [Dehalococcoidales bacterium]|nr:hypothetical protein [Dehalococcoidales bacterium]